MEPPKSFLNAIKLTLEWYPFVTILGFHSNR